MGRPVGGSLTPYLLIAALTVATDSPLVAQDASSEPACGTCAIRLDTVATLGSLDGPGASAISAFATVAVDGAGRILVASRIRSDHFAVFDSAGRYLSSVGRSGEGPGEYRFISGLAAGPRYLHVVDDEQGRRTMLTYGFSVVRTDRLPGHIWSSAALASDALVLAATLPGARDAGPSVHVLHTDGVLIRLAASHEVEPDHPTALHVHADAETFWTAADRRYELTEWDARVGGPRRVVTMAAHWFDDENPEAFPRSLLLGVVSVGDTLWVVGRAPDAARTERSVPGRDPSVPIDDPIRIWDGVLDAVDARTGTRLAHIRVDAPFLGSVSGGDLIAQYGEDGLGVPFIHVIRPVLAALRPQTPSDGR